MSTKESLMHWLYMRMEHACTSTIPLYVGQFESMWLEEFDTLDTIPQSVKDMVNRKYQTLRAIS